MTEINLLNYFNRDITENYQPYLTSIRKIKPYCYYNTKTIYNLTLPSNIEFVGDLCFGYSSIHTLDFSQCDKLFRIGLMTQMAELENIILPPNIQKLQRNCFTVCPKLTRLFVPSSMTIIESGTFDSNMKEIVIYKPKDSISGAPWGASGANVIWLYGPSVYIKSNPMYTVTLKVNGETLTQKYYNGNVGDVVEYIVSYTGYTSQSGSTILTNDITTIEVGELQILPLYTRLLEDSSLNDLILSGDDITHVGNGSFRGCNSLTSFSIDNCPNLTTIGNYCFHNCINLESVDLSNCTSLTTLGDYCFQNCQKLTSIDMSGCTNLTTLEDDCFYGCKTLTDVILPPNITTINSSCFDNCKALTSVIFDNHPTLVYVGADCYSDCDALETVDFSGATNLTTFGGKALFYSCESLKNVTLPPNLTELPESLFDSCSGLETIIIPNSVTTIWDRCFKYCSSLKNITFPTSLTSFSMGSSSSSYSPFYRCSVLESVDLSNCTNLTTMPKYTFYNCTSLTNVALPSSLTSINSSCFGSCSNLTTITINKPKDSISGAPWGATNATIIWNG